MKIGMRFEGGAELARELDRLSVRLSKKLLHEALREGAEPIRRAAATKAPRSDEAPHIADNIGIANARPGDAMAAVSIGPVKGFAYGLPLEVGTVHHSAQPFMRPAFDIEIPESLRIISQALWRELAAKGVSRTATQDADVQHEGALL